MSETPIDFNALDTAVHGPLRLGILTALRVDGPLDFTTLKKRMDAPDGSMSMHLHKLEAVGYVTAEREFVGRRPRSTYRLTPGGRRALSKYLDSLRRLIDAMDRAS